MSIESNWKQLCVYVYDSEKIKEVTLCVVKLLNEYRGLFKNVVLDKSWIYGPSLKIQVNVKNEHNAIVKRDELFSRIRNEVHNQKDKNEKVDYLKYEIISKRLALIENYKGTILPLRNNYTVIEENINIEDIKTIYDKDFYLDIKSTITEFICDSYEWFFGLSSEDKDIYLVKLMIILTHYDISESKTNAGIKYAYLTYKSHYEGFVKQLKDNSKSKEVMMSMIKDKGEKVKNFQEGQFANFLNNIESEFINYKDEDRLQMINWLTIVKTLLGKYKDALATGKINFEDYHDIKYFLNNNKDLSNFHKNLAANSKLVEVMRSQTILNYRLCINTFYSMLPLINISPLKKHVLCKYVCDAVEDHFKMNYIGIMEERAASYN